MQNENGKMKQSGKSGVRGSEPGVLVSQSPTRIVYPADVRGSAEQSAIRNPQSRGFTLIELLTVMAIIGILITIAQPELRSSVIRAREAVLKEDLFQIRDAIDQYYADNGKYPAELTELTNQSDKSRSYLRQIPKDPFTGNTDWITVALEGEETGVFDVHSASPLVALNGTSYNTW
jgi:general secretion pathway protein G